MNDRRPLVLAIAAAAAAIIAFRKRPVKHPKVEGSWEPTRQQRSRTDG